MTLSHRVSHPVSRSLGRATAVGVLCGVLSACGITLKTDSNSPSVRHFAAPSTASAPARHGEPELDGLRLARLLRDQGRYEGAATVYAQLEQRGSLGPLELLEYASVAAPVQSARESLALFGRARRAFAAASIAPTPAATVALCNGLGRSRMALGQHEAALADFDCTLTAEPDNVAALNAKGVLLDARGDHAQARQLFSRALELDPADFRMLNNLALSHLAAGEAEDAIRLLSQADATQWPTLTLNLAFAHALQGDATGAGQALSQVVAAARLPEARAELEQRVARVRGGASLAAELLAASRRLLPLRAAEEPDHG